jgi:hypothetical protein
MLGKLAERYGLGPIVAIDPHNFNNEELSEHRSAPGATSFDEFLKNIESAGVSSFIEVHREFSTDVAKSWNRPISLLWIDGDHSYRGAKADFDGFMPHVVPGGFVALHDALHPFAGPIRVFVEDVLQSGRFGAAGFVNSIAWSQYRPEDSVAFRQLHQSLESPAKKLIPLIADEKPLHGMKKMRFKLARARVPRTLPSIEDWSRMLNP